MFYALKGNLRSLKGNGFIRAARRVAGVALLSLLVSVAASAYTIVLKSGRHIEIPAGFTVTPLTLTYEAAPGINITLLMATVDIPATERANNEAAGALLKRAEQKSERNQVSTQPRSGRRELTQADIERGRAERQKSEQAYERRRKELGLPSLDEARRRTEEETKRLREESLKSQAEVAESEAYWRGRSTELRTELLALDKQIGYVRALLGESPYNSAVEAYALVNGMPLFVGPRRVTDWPHRAPARFPVVTGNPGFMRGANGATGQGAGFLAFGGSGRQVSSQLNVGAARGNFGGRGRVSQGLTGVPATLYIVPDSNSNYYDQPNLLSRLHELEAERAGLQERWRLLEEEARRAGAQPGWLRP